MSDRPTPATSPEPVPAPQPAPAAPHPHRAETLRRVAGLADATVAIALTFLVLPLLEVAPEIAETRLGPLLYDHLGELIAFLVSFFAIAAFWRGNRRLFENLGDYDDTLVFLTLLWLLVIVFIPFPTAMLPIDGPQTSTTVFYLGTLAVGASVAAAQAIYVVAHPGLLHERASRSTVLAVAYRALGAVAVFALAAVVAIASAVAGLLVLLLIPLVSVVANRVAARMERTAARG